MAYFYPLGIMCCAGMTALIYALGPYSTETMFLADQGAGWYYWKLAEPDFWSHFTAWSFYALHQVCLWGLIAYAQHRRPKYSKKLNKFNVLAIGLNIFFVLLHVLQTKIWYDGLAQVTSVWSSQFSVIFMLVFVLMMENRRRGLFFGRKFSVVDAPAEVLRRYHGYYFAWAIVYTFWFHPIEDNMGHALGAFYTFMLLLQGSLFFSRYHVNPKWTLFLELFVVLHGTMVAYMTLDNGQWRMFLWGFLGIFVITQMHGVGLSSSVRKLIFLGFCLGVAWSYRSEPMAMTAVLRIPGGELGLVFLLTALFYLFKKIHTLFTHNRRLPFSL
jgi:hypothetical protein